MTKKTYDVSFSRVGSFSAKRKDSSFSSCLCTMLVILVICALLLLLSFSFKKFAYKKEYNERRNSHEKIIFNDTTTMKNIMYENPTENIPSTTTSTDNKSSKTDLINVDKQTTPSEEETNNNEETAKTFSTISQKKSSTKSSETETTMTTMQKSSFIGEVIEETPTTTFSSLEEDKSSETERIMTTLQRSHFIGKEIEEMPTTTFSSLEEGKSSEAGTTMTTMQRSQFVEKTIEDTPTTPISSLEEETWSTYSTGQSVQTIPYSSELIRKITTTPSIELEETTTTREEETTGYSTLKKKESITEEETYSTEQSFTKSSDLQTTLRETQNLQTETSTITEEASSEATEEVTLSSSTYEETLTTQSVHFTEAIKENQDAEVITESTVSGRTQKHLSNLEDSGGTTMTDQDYSTSSEKYTRTIPEISSKIGDYNNTNICHSSICNLSTSSIIASMNLTEMPCYDFYNFACGGSIREKNDEIDIFQSEILEQESLKFLKDFNNFYSSCKHYEDHFLYRDRILKLYEILNSEVYGQTEGMKNVITDLLSNLLLLEAFPHLDVGIDVNPKKPSTFIAVLMKPKYKPLSSTYWSSFSENRRKCIRKIGENSLLEAREIRKEYWNCMSNYSDFLNTLRTMQKDKNDFLNETMTMEFMDEFIENLSNSLMTFGNDGFLTPYDYEESFSQVKHTMKIRDLQEKCPILDWARLLSSMGNQEFHNFSEILIDQRTEKMISDWGRFNDTDFLAILETIVQYSIYENIVLQSHVDSRIDFCKEQTKYLMPDITNFLYKTSLKSKHEENNIYITEIFESIKKVFHESLEKSTWIDDISKIGLEKKLEEMKIFLYDTKVKEEERRSLEAAYKEIVTKLDDYPSNLISFMKHKKRSVLALQGREVNPATIFQFLLGADEKLPLLFTSSGYTYIPYGLIKKASRKLPGYLVMSQVGFPLARIIGKHFSPNEIQTILRNSTADKLEHFVNHVTDEASMRAKFHDQYLYLQDPSSHQIFDLITENTAVRILTDSSKMFEKEPLLPMLHTQFSREQIFFIGIAQEFCTKNDAVDVLLESVENGDYPIPIKIEDIFRNSMEFSEQFSCPGELQVFEKQFPYIPNFDNPIVSN